MMEYCRKRKIDVVGWVKSIPMSQKLYMADIQKGRAVLGADRNIESAFGIYDVSDDSNAERNIPVFECQD